MSEPANIPLNSLISQIGELRNFEIEELEDDKLLSDVVDEVENKINQTFSECSENLSSLPNEDLNKFLEHLKKELGEVESENANFESEIERCMEDNTKLESELHSLLKFIESQSPENEKEHMQMDVSYLAADQADFPLKTLSLSHQIEENKTTLKSMEDLDTIFKRFEAIEKIEDTLTGLTVIEIEECSIRLSLKTYIPFLESVLSQQGIEVPIEPLEMNHEIIIETVDGSLELKNVEIFPNDVYMGEIIEAAKSFRQLYPRFSIEARSSLEWFVRRVQERIALSSLRQCVVKNSNKLRHSFEYLDREDIIVAHIVGEVDALIKLPQGWPLSDLALELISLKSRSQHSKEVSLSFLCTIVEMANSLNSYVRKNISNFTDSIEEIIMQQMQADR
ncbi:hypothetical protein ACJIZ3_018099 [Penstemon smallii]|uniref:Uncharacterized protein n=1 Tax=Penstemon smallii TaxID=265156 RepID=A0ABD3SYR8_9LAMI